MRVEAADKKTLARWAADCAERALPAFETRFPRDERPRRAIEAARKWARDELPFKQARAAALAAHASARAAVADPAACAAARAAGHAAATAHSARHAGGAALYAALALGERERSRCLLRLPPRLRPLGDPGALGLRRRRERAVGDSVARKVR